MPTFPRTVGTVPDLAEPIRNVLIANEPITAMLATYLDGPAVFTRRPVPPNSGYPLILVSGNIAKTDADGINDNRPIITRDISIYGLNDTADTYRNVAVMGDLIFHLFHHVFMVLPIDTSGGWNLVDIHCMGPIIAPTEDDLIVGRVVSLRITLANQKG